MEKWEKDFRKMLKGLEVPERIKKGNIVKYPRNIIVCKVIGMMSQRREIIIKQLNKF